MTALVNYTDVLYVQSNQTWDGVGANYIDNRTKWFNLNNSNLSLISPTFTLPGGTIVNGAAWTSDSGPNTMAISEQEPRAFCLVGKVNFTFTGTTLLIRLNTDYGWGNDHVVYIDGVQPTSISGILTAVNSVSCDSETYGFPGPAYVDVLIADGLTNTSHTVDIYVNETGSSFFSLAGFKTAGFVSQNINQTGMYIMPPSYELTQNETTLTVLMKGPNTIQNVTLAFPSGLVSGTNTALSTLSNTALTTSLPSSQELLPNFTGSEVSGAFTYALTLSGQYPDPTGVIVENSTATLLANSSLLTLGGTSWAIDNSAPGGVPRIYSDAKGSTTNELTFSFPGSSLTITVEQNYGYGTLGIYNTSNTLLYSISCSADADQLYSETFTGFSTGTNTVHLRKTTTDTTEYVVFVSASWPISETFTEITETVNLVINASQPVATPVLGVAVGEFNMTFNQPIESSSNLTATPVQLNTDIAYTEVLSRFPTFAVCYQPGFADILSQYDILIVDPFAAHAADVLAWQALGIKVFGYISLGEEDGFYSNRYDFTSAAGPYVGNGEGPGGTAGYYLKGGFQSRECNECANDNQAILGTKTCALSQPMYYQPLGRCSSSCKFDSLDGYTAFSTGGACGAGFTSANNWKRASANSACVNTSCPSYYPIHQIQTGTKCPTYSAAANLSNGAYLQDFSISSPDTPDQNGVFASYYTNQSSSSGWLSRIQSYYAPTVLGGPIIVTGESITVSEATISSGSVFVFNTAQYPIDPDATISVMTAGDAVTYTANVDFTFDMKTGAFVFNTGITPAVISGQVLTINYTKKGHTMDGIFMDTIDDADVYPAIGSEMSSMINSLKSYVGEDVMLLSNRGFTNLNDYIQSCHGVMFESWLVDWDENTGVYSIVTDEPSLSFNDSINAQLQELRLTNVFDVYSLNYCDAGSAGETIQAYCRSEDAKKGYLSWQSTIDLNNPAANSVVTTPGLPITTNNFTRIQLETY